MSLINKMLQDLDARGSQPGAALPPEVRTVAPRERGVPRLALIGGAAALCGGAIALGWTYLRHAAPKPAAPLVAVTQPVQPPQPKQALVVAPAAPHAGIHAIPAAIAVPSEPPVPSPVQPSASEAAPVRVRAAAPAREKRVSSKVRDAEMTKITGRREAQLAEKTIKTAVPMQEGKQVTTGQRAENDYRRGLDALQEGRVPEALARLQQALAVEPRHQAARETLVRLLLENQRPDEAMRQLQLSLSLDPKQPAQAMMLSRMQLEKGGGALAVDTLMRALPFASDNGDYRAFLAGVLQRQQRSKEAAEQYQLALQHAPQNGVWWMGLGIALQADGRPLEAKDAFLRARASANLSADLQAFVERKLVQLAGR